MDRTSELRGILGQIFAWNKSRLDCFVGMLLALFSVRTVNLSEIALAMDSRAMKQSRYRRLQRFFAEFKIDYSILARWIFSLFFNLEKKVYLSLDRTNWYWGKAPINALVLSIAYEGVAIPIYWTLLKKDGTSNTEERIAIMEKFINTFGVNCIQSLLADREFIGGKWFQWLLKNKIPFCIRVKENTAVSVFRGKSKAVKYLFQDLQQETQKVYENYVNVFGHRLRVVGGRSKKGELLIVVTSHDPKNAVSIYLRRWEIECLFSSLKSHGFRFEETHITATERIEKLMALLAVGFSWAHKVGEWRANQRPIAMKKHKDGTVRPQYTFFRYGFDEIREAILDLQKRWQQFKRCLRQLYSPGKTAISLEGL